MQHFIQSCSLRQLHTFAYACKTSGSIPGNEFSIPLTVLITFAVASTAFTDHCPFSTLLSCGNREESGSEVQEIWRMLQKHNIAFDKVLFSHQ
jgi:hypothetical protein